MRQESNPFKTPPKKRLFGRQADSDFKPSKKSAEDEDSGLLLEIEGLKLDKKNYVLYKKIIGIIQDNLIQVGGKTGRHGRINMDGFLLNMSNEGARDGKLVSLFFGGVGLDIETLKTLAPLIIDSDVKLLALNDNAGIGSESASIIADIMKHSNIKELFLYKCGLGTDGATVIAEALPNSKITHLELGFNFLNDDAAYALAKAIPNSNLKFLDLGRNNISVKAGRIIKEAAEKKNIKLVFT